MIRKLLGWLDDRTGAKSLLHAALFESIPGGARWRYIFGSTLVFTFLVQVVTGVFLWMCYSPGARSAWESVYYIQYDMQGGWLLRGIHHYTAQAMVVLLALHLLQVVIDKAYRAPREINFWLGLILLQIVLGLALTGYLLPWDQKGFWATSVATNLMGLVPFIGPELQKVAIGGTAYGHATLTRFFALHAGVLPGLLIAVLCLHLLVFRRHGVCAVGAEKRPAQDFWPHQALRDGIACMAVLAVVLFLVFKGVFTGDHSGEPPGAYLGAGLSAPADPAVPYPAARPEWYFLFLFQLLKFFQGEIEIVGAIILPGLVMAGLFLMPFIGRFRLGHRFNMAITILLGLGVLTLTGMALYEDGTDPAHREAVQLAEQNARRAILLARSPAGIPETGAISLLRDDPKTQGPALFTRHCAGCHAHAPPEGGVLGEGWIAVDAREPAASNLYRYGTRSWLTGLLDPYQIAGPRYFGNTAHKKSDMVEYVQKMFPDPEEWPKELVEQVVSALLAESGHEPVADGDEEHQTRVEKGRALIQDPGRCAQCHRFHEENEYAYGPDLTGYASRKWMIDFISDPGQERFYGKRNDGMPAYAKDPGEPLENILTAREISLIVDWLRGDWYEKVR